jgi:predicted oxidoreductase
VEFTAGEKRAYLTEHGISFLPTVGWAERSDLSSTGHGNSVPRFHVSWGTGTGVVEPFVNSALDAAGRGSVTFCQRHRVDGLVRTDGAVTGVRDTVLAPDDAPRGAPSSRQPVGGSELSADAVVITTGGIGANHDMVRNYWPQRMGTAPSSMITGVPAYVDGRMLDIRRRLGSATGQPRPHVALHRRRRQLEPDLARPRDTHPARAATICFDTDGHLVSKI